MTSVKLQTSEGAVSQSETRLAESSPKRRNGAGLCHWAKSLGTDPREQAEDGGTALRLTSGGPSGHVSCAESPRPATSLFMFPFVSEGLCSQFCTTFRF